jgi:chromate transporter
VAVLVFGLYLSGINVILLLFGFGLLYMVFANRRRLVALRTNPIALTGAASALWGSAGATVGISGSPVSLTTLTLTFLKLGLVVYGSGYVLLAFLRADFVQHLHWLTDQQLIDAVAVGQFTPGPVFTTATFLGYLFAGFPGALLATLAIFLPSFVLVALIYPFISRLRESVWLGAFLDGANAAALGLMAAVTVQLARASIVDVPTLALALIAAFVLFRFRPNSAWIVLGGAAAGAGLKLVGL